MEISVRLICHQHDIPFAVIKDFLEENEQYYYFVDDPVMDDIYIERIDVDDFLEELEAAHLRKVRNHQFELECYIDSFLYNHYNE